MGKQPWRRQLLLATMGLIALFTCRWNLGASFNGFLDPSLVFLHENLTVGPYFLPGWSGALTGVRALDRVVAVNGRPLQRAAKCTISLRAHQPTRSFYYRVIRDSQPFEFAASNT